MGSLLNFSTLFQVSFTIYCSWQFNKCQGAWGRDTSTDLRWCFIIFHFYPFTYSSCCSWQFSKWEDIVVIWQKKKSMKCYFIIFHFYPFTTVHVVHGSLANERTLWSFDKKKSMTPFIDQASMCWFTELCYNALLSRRVCC